MCTEWKTNRGNRLRKVRFYLNMQILFRSTLTRFLIDFLETMGALCQYNNQHAAYFLAFLRFQHRIPHRIG